MYIKYICKLNNTVFFLQYCLLDLLVGVVQPSVLRKVATLNELKKTKGSDTYLWSRARVGRRVALLPPAQEVEEWWWMRIDADD